MPIAAIISLIQVLTPAVTNVIMMIKDKETGKLTIMAVLDSVDAQVASNQKAIADWLASHPA